MADDINELEPEYGQKWWKKEVELAEKELTQGLWKSGDKIVERYLDRRQESSGDITDENARKYNIFWANVQITKAALYATPPKPEVKRQSGDAKDDVARTAALILQRMLALSLSKDESDMHEAFKLAIDDRLIPGLGQVWLRLDVETEKYMVPAPLDAMGQPMGEPTEAERIVHEEVCTDYVHWRDFLMSPARIWSEVWWVGRRVWMRKAKFKKRFGEAKYELVKDKIASFKDTSILPKGFKDGKIEVIEIWCLDTNKVYWINRDMDELLDERPDPLRLEDFFPCPPPLLATHTTNNYTPRADYTMVQDQYEELDILNDRISILTKALRVVGVYDKTSAELGKLLTGGEFQMIPVDNWAAFAETGGLKGTVDWFPVEVIAEVLGKLMDQRIAVINQIYELTSISDIMRGASNPRDTLGAQKLKAQYSSVRLQLNQQDVGLFVRRALRIKAEIIAKHFQPQTIYEQSQIEHTESAIYAQPAIELIKNYEASEYRIEVGEQQLSLADYNAERELRTEYLVAVGQFISQAAQILEAQPAAAPYLLKMIAWVTAAFRGSSDIETVLDQAIQAASQPTQPTGEADPIAQAQGVGQAEAESEQAKNQSRAAADIAVADNKTKNATMQSLVKVIAAHAMPVKPEPEGKKDD